MFSMPESRTLMARVMVARGIADPVSLDRLVETTPELSLGKRRAARFPAAVATLRERADRFSADLLTEIHRIVRLAHPAALSSRLRP